MRDNRINILAHNIVFHAVHCQKNEKVLIEAKNIDRQFVQAIIENVYKAGGYPIVNLLDAQIESALLHGTSVEHCQYLALYDRYRMTDIDCYIGLRGGDNTFDLATVPEDNIKIFDKYYNFPVHHEVRVAQKKWVILRYPSPSMAQNARMATDAFEDLYFNVCNLNYQKMGHAMKNLKILMEQTDKVRLVAKGTDLTFSIKNMPAIPCAGEMNIPDGEIYTAPVCKSLEGVITFNSPAIHKGKRFEEITLSFKEGRVEKAITHNQQALDAILDTDAGAKYVGEFAIGLNPYLTHSICDTLFDEKISGSIHLALGSCYDNAYNGNKSSIHWDLVLIMTAEYGGGEIYFDDILIQKNGRFVLPALEMLNPENLK